MSQYYDLNNTGPQVQDRLDQTQENKQDIATLEGKVTAIENEIGESGQGGNTINARLDALETAVGSGGSVDERIAAAETEIIGGASSDYNTLGKVEGELEDTYRKNETYSKTELDNLITTPNVLYVTVIATNGTTDVTTLLPATGAADTVYRVGNWDGTQYDTTMYALYAWNGSAYVCLSVRSFVGEVYDVSVNHPDGQGNPTPYADLAAALGTNGANIPADIRRGGMSIKFIQGTVQSSDNKYVQYRYMATDANTVATFTDVTIWQGVDAVPVEGSRNLIESGGVEAGFAQIVGHDVFTQISYNPDDYILVNYKTLNDATPVPLDNAVKVSVTTVMAAATTYPMMGFYDSNDVLLESLGYDDFSRPGNYLNVITDYPVPNGATKMRIVAWNQDRYDEQKSNCYIHVYAYVNNGGMIGHLEDLDTTAKDNLVHAINEVIDSLGDVKDDTASKILSSGNVVQLIEHCLGDAVSFTVGNNTMTTGMAVWEAGANNYVRILNPSNIYCIVATETIPKKGPTGTTLMDQFNPELLAEGVNLTPIRFNHVVMPPDKGYLVVYYITESLDNLVYLPSMKERMALEERSNLNFFSGKKISFMGDSLFNDGPKVCQYFSWMSGMQIINGERNLLSKGGYPTLIENGVENCMQARAYRLENLPEPDVLVIENVNDGQGEDYTDAELAELVPFMLVDWNDFLPGVQSVNDAKNYFTTNFATLVAGITPHLGSMIRVAYGTSSFRITITGVATANGDASIIIRNDTYTVTLSTSMTKADIATLFAAYNFSGFTVDYTSGNEYFDLIEIGSGTTVNDITYDAGTTGSKATKVQSSSYGYVGYCYYSDAVTGWNNSENWVLVENVPLIAQYKGLLEYLCTTFPDMWIFWLLAMRYDSNGARNRNKRLRNYLPQWGIPYLDTETAASINIWNYRNFCESGIHINQYDKGAMRWAEAMVRGLL